MGEFWPSGLDLSDSESPKAILQKAKQDWEASSKGVMTLMFQDAKSEGGNDIIIAHAVHVPSNRTSSLFSVVSRPSNPYPSTFQPKGDDLPNFLKKSYSQRGFASMTALAIQDDRRVENR